MYTRSLNSKNGKALINIKYPLLKSRKIYQMVLQNNISQAKNEYVFAKQEE